MTEQVGIPGSAGRIWPTQSLKPAALISGVDNTRKESLIVSTVALAGQSFWTPAREEKNRLTFSAEDMAKQSGVRFKVLAKASSLFFRHEADAGDAINPRDITKVR